MTPADPAPDRPAPGLDVGEVAPDPLVQFRRWFDDALSAGLAEADSVVLSTVDEHGWPQSRTVLLKGVDRGFVVYTHYASAKGRQMDATGRAALVFLWPGLRRQVRAVGTAARIDPAESDAYFATRPRGSQLGAWASDQHSVIGSRAELDRRFAVMDARFEGREVPRPPWWGGYRIVPVSVELWQGRDNRMHDRVRYLRDGGRWRIERLEP